MKTILVAALIALCVAIPVPFSEDDELVINHDLINNINSNSSSWIAGENERFRGWTIREAKKLLGALFSENSSLPVKSYGVIAPNAIPASFDARQQWPEYIHPIRDQQQCGSCWAFAASEAMSDRLAIASKGSVNKVLSPEDMVSCDQSDMGCQGGYLDRAWEYIHNTGIVTDACFPYTAGRGVAASCASKCVDGEAFTRYKTKDSFQLKTVQDIQMEIMTNGPVEGGFMVHKSFMNYRSGVYQHHWWNIFDNVLGGHAIKILGWGTENGVDYWLCANSWNTIWGDNGFFKIRRGNNECQLESQVFAGHPAI